METEKEHIVVVGFGWVGQANGLALSRMGYPVGYFDLSTVTKHYSDQYADEYEKISTLTSVLAWEEKKPWYIVCVGDKVDFDTGEQHVETIRKALESLSAAKGRVILRSTIIPRTLGTLSFDVYVPEFLHEKFAVAECEYPYFFVVGQNHEIAHPSFFATWKNRAERSFFGTPGEASYVKYLSNLWNSTKIAFVNEFGDAIGDPATTEGRDRINKVINFVMNGGEYLRYGGPFSGHCLPKDTRAFLAAHGGEEKLPMVAGIWDSNEKHRALVESLKDRPLPVWYSKWESSSKEKPLVARMEERVRHAKIAQPILPFLRWLRREIENVLPARSLARSRAIWDKKVAQNALYFMNTKTRSGFSVDENEFQETGREDVYTYVLGDTQLMALLGDAKEKQVLEIGCGSGRMTKSFAENFKKVVGVDISPKALAYAEKRLEGLGNVECMIIDGASLPFPNNSFPFVFSYLTLQHVPTYKDLKSMLSEIARVLTPGGVAKIQLRTGAGVPRWRWSYGVSVRPEKAVAVAESLGFRVRAHTVEDIKNLWLTVEKI